MRKTAVLSAVTVAMMFSAPAYSAECKADLANLNEKISKNDNNYRVTTSGPQGTNIRKLRDAARILDQNGNQEACRSVVEAMEQMLSGRKAQDASARETQGAGARETMNYDSWNKREIDRIKAARPVGDMKQPLRATVLIGADVRNMDNNDLGEIEDFVLDPNNGKVQMVLLSHGGFLGMGEEQIAVPWQELSVAGKEDDRVFILNISEEMIDEAPRYKRGEWSMINTEAWRQKNEQFYKKNKK